MVKVLLSAILAGVACVVGWVVVAGMLHGGDQPFDLATREQAVLVVQPRTDPPPVSLGLALPEPYPYTCYHCDMNRGSQPIVRVAPVYPKRCGTSGATVRLKLRIAPRGDVIEANVIESDDQCFNLAARTAAMDWKYAPRPDGTERTVEFLIRFAGEAT